MMNGIFPTARMIAWLMAVWMIASAAHAEVTCRISSRFLARGEKALLEVAVIGQQPTAFPLITPIQGVEIRPTGRGPQTRMIPGRRIEHVFEYLISSYEIGEHRIDPIELELGGVRHRSEPLDFSVFNPDELEWSEAEAGDIRFRYASTFKVLDDQPYVGEAVPVEIKVFVPRDLFVDDWGIPDFERKGLTAWRMQPSQMRSQINLLGMPYTSVAYPSTLMANRSGEVSIGPAEVRLITRQTIIDGIHKRVWIKTQLKVAEKTITARALPANAPAGFRNAVGRFKINVTTPTTEVNEGDPIALDIVVSGSGNLDTLDAPQPIDREGWKVYEASRLQRGDERRELSGSVAFQQFMRPLEIQPSVPSFRLVYLNPETGEYESTDSEPIGLQMNPAPAAPTVAVGPPPAADTPIEEMTDILGIIPGAALTRPAKGIFSHWWIHAAGALLALVLIAKALWMRHRHRLQPNPERNRRISELRQLDSAATNDHEFLMAAGRFVERWLGSQASPEIRDIVAERDALCFRGGEPTTTRLPSQRRKEILRTLRQAATRCLIIAACLVTTGLCRAQDPVTTAEQSYDSARYDQAIETWLGAAPYDELSADTLYHIGNACYRAGSPGHAALYYRRALARDGGHQESRQNLRFIERKYGALSIDRPDYQYLLARLPLGLWQAATWVGLWSCLLAALVFPATRSGAKLRMTAVVGLVCGPLLALSGGLGWRYFPNDAAFAPIQNQAVITAENVVLHTDASRSSPEVIQAPPGSLCEIIHQSGSWAYVAFASQTRGWLPTTSIRRIIPDEPPQAPEIRKPLADETNA